MNNGGEVSVMSGVHAIEDRMIKEKPMRKLLLTSTSFPTGLITDAFLDMLDQDPAEAELSAVIITTAAVQLKEQARPTVKAKRALEAMGFRKVDFLDVEFEEADCLADYDVICLSGGNPFHLLHHLRLSGADKLLEELSRKGVVLVGISAGTMVLAPDIRIVDHFTPHFNQVGMQDLSALHLYDWTIFPHYGREDKFPDEKSHEERILEFEAAHHCTVERLTDREAVWIQGDTVRKISEGS